jgi:small subunit ribosomal protein S5
MDTVQIKKVGGPNSNNNNNRNQPRGGRRPFNKNRPGHPDQRRAKDDIKYDILRGERITKVTSGGKTLRFRIVAIAGDQKGQVGFALAKARQQNIARDKAKVRAAKSLVKVPILTKNGSIPHIVMGKYGACQVFIKPAPEGTGIIAGGTVRKILVLAGIRNIYSKVYGSRTRINVVRATMDALAKLKTATKIAEMRGKTVQEIFRP